MLAMALLFFQQAALVRLQQANNEFSQDAKRAPPKPPPPPPPPRDEGVASSAGSSQSRSFIQNNIPVEDKIVTPPPPPARDEGVASSAGSSQSRYIQNNIPVEDKIVTIYETPPELANFPNWIQNYVRWHQEIRQKYPGMKLFTDPEAPKLLIRTCLGICGGLHDRLGQLPFDLFLANQTQRLLLIGWQRPRELENFLLPNVVDWSIPKEAHFGFDDIRTVRNYTELFGGYDEDHPDDEFWNVHFDEALKRANEGAYKDIRILRHRILGHIRESELERRLVQLNEDPKVHEAPTFGMIFWLFFRPSEVIDHMFRQIMRGLHLVPNEYSAVHCR